MRRRAAGRLDSRVGALLLGSALVFAGCGAPPVRGEPAEGPQNQRELESRVRAARQQVQRYRTVERRERLNQDSGQWELVVPSIATDYVLPDRKHQRPADPTEPSILPEYIILGPTVYQSVQGLWVVVDPSQIPAESQLATSFQQLRTAGLDGSPFRVPTQVEGRLTAAGSELLDGRACRWFHGTAAGPAGPVQLRVAIEEQRDLPCGSEAEYAAPAGRARQAVRYFDYNAPLQIEAPAVAS